LNDHFRLFVFALAELMMSNTPLRIDEIEGRPILVLESAPYRVAFFQMSLLKSCRYLSLPSKQ